MSIYAYEVRFLRHVGGEDGGSAATTSMRTATAGSRWASPLPLPTGHAEHSPRIVVQATPVNLRRGRAEPDS